MRNVLRVAIVVMGALLFAGACSSSSPAPAAPAKGPTARFALAGDAMPAFGDVPFPTDAYLAQGHVVDPLPGLDRVAKINSQYFSHALHALDGFSRVGMALFYVDDTSAPLDDQDEPTPSTIDPASLPLNEDACVADTSAVFLVDLAAEPSKARVRCRAGAHDDRARLSKTRPVVAVGPGLGVVLEESHAYAAVITSRVKDTDGRNVAATADFQALVAGTRSGAMGTLYGGAIDKVRAAIGAALDADKSRIVAIAPFTTHTTTKQLFQMRESLEAMPVPALAWDAQSMAPMGATKFAALVGGVLPAGFTASLDDWLGVATDKLPDGTDDPDFTLPVRAHAQIAAIGSAVFDAVNFLAVRPTGYDDLEHATFTYDAAGNIVPDPAVPTVKIWVSIAVPKTPMPPGGYPCIIAQHGSNGSRAELFMALANVFANKGWMTVAIDSVTFGARAPEAKFQVDQHTDWEASPGAKYKGPDGMSDNVDAGDKPSVAGTRNTLGDQVGALKNIAAARDQARQGPIDIAQLVRVLGGNPDLSPLATGGAAPKIDATRLAYVGGSNGANIGALAAAIEPNVKLWLLNVGASELGNTIVDAPIIGNIISLGAFATFGVSGDYFNYTSPAAALLQTANEPGDAIAYASYWVKSPGTIKGARISPRNVLAIEVLFDEWVANEGSEALARAAGYGLALPNVGTNAGARTLDQVRDPTKIVDRIVLPDVAPDANDLIHDTPIPGITTVLVQQGPGTHYRNLTASHENRGYAVPFNDKTVMKQFSVRNPYRETQAMMLRFFDDGFQGKVPNVTGFKPPVRDVDDDGTPDATDPDPSDPNVK
jgi:hypothetical protein